MIVEDENGQNVYLNDLGGPEPSEPPGDVRPPLDLDAVAGHYHEALAEDMSGIPWHSKVALAAVPELVAELRAAREDLAYWRSLPLHAEYAITNGDHPDTASVIWPGSAEDALRLAAEDETRQGWVRSVTVHGWVEFGDELPF